MNFNISIKSYKAWTLMFSLWGCLSDAWFEYSSLKVTAVSPKQNSDKILYLWMNFQKLFDQNPQRDFFRVWTSFMFVDKDLWKLRLFLPNKTVTKCYISKWIFKSCLIKIHKLTSLKYEPVLFLLTKIFESYSCFSETKPDKMLHF